MAANFWASTHYRHWLRRAENILSEQRVSRKREQNLLSEEEHLKAKAHFPQLISTLAQKTSLRQRIAATAIVYFKRFYVRNNYRDHDPRLIAPGALYLAAKAEEHTLQAKVVVAQMAAIYSGEHKYPYTVEHLYDCEFKLIRALKFDLIVYHPYRPLMQYCTDLQKTELLSTAWPILNDSYQTDACLLYPPYLIAIAAICMAGTLEESDMMPWVRTLNVDTTELGDIVLLLSSVYSAPQPSSSSISFEMIMNKLHSHFAPRIQASNSSAVKKPPTASSRPKSK